MLRVGSAVVIVERKRQPTLTNEPEKKDEEEWPLKDVVFIEDIKTVPVGKVLKVSLVFIFVYCQKQRSSNHDSLTDRSQMKTNLKKDKIDNVVT